MLWLCSGKFTWRMSNFGLFRDMIRVQKIMSPPFSAGDCSLRISVYQSTVGGKEHLSLCLESKVGKSSTHLKECICMHHWSCLRSRRRHPPRMLQLSSQQYTAIDWSCLLFKILHMQHHLVQWAHITLCNFSLHTGFSA